MDCLQAREAISAQMDGEAPGLSERLLDAHVARCDGCRAWREAAFEVTRRSRMTGWTPPGDLTGTIMAGLEPRRSPVPARRLRALLLVAAAIGQVVLTVLLLAGHATGAVGLDVHDAHELGAFDFGLAVAFVVGAVRPRLAGALAWPCVAAAVGLLATSATDLIMHRTFEVHELRHLIAVCGAILLCLTARDERKGPGGAAVLAPRIRPHDNVFEARRRKCS